MTSTFQRPSFVPPHEDGANGVDYLGIRAINLAMMANVIPSINNAVNSVRPFSLLSWVAWRYEQALLSSGEEPSEARLKQFREKVETLYVWSHVQRAAATGMPGIQQKIPLTPRVRLDFASFKRNVRDEGFFGAPQYGPGLKYPDGLGFTYHEKKLFKATKAGQEMARAFDECLRAHLSSEQYSFLASIDDLDIDNADHKDYFEAWNIDSPTDVEKWIFSEQLYRQSDIGQTSGRGRRSAFLYLVRAILDESAEPLTSDGVRYLLAIAPLPAVCRDHSSAAQFALVKRRWQMMQVRQAQRLAMEALFGWVERCLMYEDASSAEDLVLLAKSALLTSDPVFGDQFGAGYLRALLVSFRTPEGGVDELFAAFSQAPGRLDIFVTMSRLEKIAGEPGAAKPGVVAQALSLLAQCAVFASAFKRDPISSAEVSAGLPHRLPLGLWATLVERYAEQSLDDFLRKLFGTHILSQHFSIAASRSSDERSRLRIGNEDRGLTSLLLNTSSVLAPKRAKDRLESALALMASCGIIDADRPPRMGGAEARYLVSTVTT